MGQRLVLDRVSTKHKVRIFISVSFQSEEVESCMMIALKYQNSLNCCIALFSLLFRSLFREESLTLYSLFWVIFTLHLLIIWTLTWVFVLSATFPSSLWVALAKVVLFRHLVHINTASKVAIVHLMRWYQSSLRYFQVFFLLPCPWSTFLSLNLLGMSL